MTQMRNKWPFVVCCVCFFFSSFHGACECAPSWVSAHNSDSIKSQSSSGDKGSSNNKKRRWLFRFSVPLIHSCYCCRPYCVYLVFNDSLFSHSLSFLASNDHIVHKFAAHTNTHTHMNTIFDRTWNTLGAQQELRLYHQCWAQLLFSCCRRRQTYFALIETLHVIPHTIQEKTTSLSPHGVLFSLSLSFCFCFQISFFFCRVVVNFDYFFFSSIPSLWFPLCNHLFRLILSRGALQFRERKDFVVIFSMNVRLRSVNLWSTQFVFIKVCFSLSLSRLLQIVIWVFNSIH